jgi:hypothetical protein
MVHLLSMHLDGRGNPLLAGAHLARPHDLPDLVLALGTVQSDIILLSDLEPRGVIDEVRAAVFAMQYL